MARTHEHRPTAPRERTAAVRLQAQPAAPADPWNVSMTQILRDAAEIRDRLELVRSAEDRRLAAQESAAALDLISAHARAPVATANRPAPSGRDPG